MEPRFEFSEPLGTFRPAQAAVTLIGSDVGLEKRDWNKELVTMLQGTLPEEPEEDSGN